MEDQHEKMDNEKEKKSTWLVVIVANDVSFYVVHGDVKPFVKVSTSVLW